MRGLPVILGAVGSVAGLSALALGVVPRAAGADREEIDRAVAALRERDAQHDRELAAAAADAVEAQNGVRALAARLSLLASVTPGTSPEETGGGSVVQDDDATTPGSARASSGLPRRIDEICDLGGRVMRETATPEEREAFFRLAKEDGLADLLVARAQAAVDAQPESAALRMELADAFVVKLLTVPGGPEQESGARRRRRSGRGSPSSIRSTGRPGTGWPRAGATILTS